MYLISIYFDKKSSDTISRYIAKVAETTGNTFMTDNYVPPHITVTAFEARNDEAAIKVFEQAVNNFNKAPIQYVSVGVFLPYVLYITPVLNEYLHNMCSAICEKIEEQDDIILNRNYKPFSYMPHTTIAKKLDSEQMRMAFEIMQKNFIPFEAYVERIGLAKPNPHRDIVMWELENIKGNVIV